MKARFHGRVVWITGASAGIGRALSLAFAAEGARVGMTARRRSGLEAVAAEIEALGGACTIAPGDVSSREETRGAAQRVESILGPVDILVNNAALLRPATVLEADPRDVEEMLAVNVMGCLHPIQAVVPGMVMRKRGQVVNVASILARRAMPLYGGYAATKFALAGLTESLRAELRGTGVSVTLVLPTGTDTAMNRQPGLPERVKKKAESGGLMTPEQVAFRVLNGVERNAREVFCNRRSQAVVLANRLAPAFLEEILSLKTIAR